MKRSRRSRRGSTVLGTESTWYKDAIIYEVRTRSFFDSNDDGIGDFRGLAAKLDYLEDLGITALWILPFYPSPGRDDGYDISDYTDVQSDVGTLTDFEHLLAESHRRGIRVITELVLNHTSDQHPWFQRARRAPAGSAERDFYVWSETPDRYGDARVIFRDFEPSNWSWDPEAHAYYWHRFYSHQPDLNFENPAVHEALLGVVDFWLAKGVDGLRLDAVPYLYEEEGTNCENLEKTHDFLKKLRAHVDSRFKNRLLLAEANQWPEDAAAYFGRGDECHMNFHFPLMPRIFMAIHQEDRLPIVDIFAQTPEVDPTCQWALFLRNHDELTLEMVTDDERDYMYRAYARQAAMRINLGIRRRLAPLVGNSRRRMELLNGLLFSLPGTPVVYYGDEIGMGDNVYLGDRNGVRTPMQWNMDRNAGFSRANPQRLILPVVIDPEYHYESLNVENQQQNPTSLLWWTKRLIAFRKRFSAFGRGTVEFLSPSNSHVLAYVRQYHQERVLIVANLSRFTQYAELDLCRYKGLTPLELFGETWFPVVGDAPYTITLGPHDFYWFSLERPDHVEAPRSVPPAVVIECASVEALLRERRLDSALLPYLENRPWMRHDRTITGVRTIDVLRLGEGEGAIFVTVVRVEYAEGEPERCVLPLAFVAEDKAVVAPAAIVARVEIRRKDDAPVLGAIVDATDEPGAARALLGAIAAGQSAVGDAGELVASVVGEGLPAPDEGPIESWKLGRERHDTIVRFADRFVLRLVRRLDEAVNPELEIGRHLAIRGSDIVPRHLAVLELRCARSEPTMLALVQGFVPHVESGWAFTIQELGRYYDRALAWSAAASPPPPPAGSPLQLVGQDPPSPVAALIGPYPDIAEQLGRRIAELHRQLGASTTDPAFAPEPDSLLDRRSRYQSLRTLAARVLRLLRERGPTLSSWARREAETVLALEAAIFGWLEPLLKVRTDCQRIRIHGHLHLGHVLFTGKDFVMTDIGG
ncbi:MAG TPA: maltose alpha-D-glucosyltransferase, partial [Polyangiaceae bacterium]|nr:maltose alpha-D-glucosyltransferase [Polyangiaceae bacterium]